MDSNLENKLKKEYVITLDDIKFLVNIIKNNTESKIKGIKGSFVLIDKILIPTTAKLERELFNLKVKNIESIIEEINSVIYYTFKTASASVNYFFTLVSNASKFGDANTYENSIKSVIATLKDIFEKLDILRIKLEKDKKATYSKAKKDNKLFGDFAFPEGRVDIDVDEPNTPIESDVENAIIDHFNDNVSIKKDYSAILQSVLKRGLYSDIIKEPEISYVYRGMLVDESWVKKILDTEIKNLKLKNYIDKKFTFKPKYGDSTSWTEDFDIALNFAKEYYNPKAKVPQFAIVLKANISENRYKFLQSNNALYNISFIHKEFHKEKEVVGLGSISVNGVTIVLL